ncbi:1,4-dihydroxy-2-naphthoate polyprenyltransferase, partial [Clostridium tepidum]
VFLMTLPAIFYIANLMLANNTCDLEEDVLNNRHTLVYYIGKENALKLFTFLAFSPFVVIILAVYLGIVPSLTLLTILVLPKVYQNT